MKKTVVILVALLAVSLTACNSGRDKISSSVAESTASSQASSEAPLESSEEESLPENETESMIPPVADAALYRGEVTEVGTGEGGGIVLTLNEVKGVTYGYPSIKVELSEDTRSAVEPGEIAVGDYIEVYYGSAAIPGDSVTAIAINRLAPADLSVINAVVESITPQEGKDDFGEIAVNVIGSNEAMVIHYTDNTQFYLDRGEIKAGDKLNIFTSGATTRSIPPQANALEIRSYAE